MDNRKAGAKDVGVGPRTDLRESEVIAYLRRNPRVLLNNPDLLTILAPETRFETDAVVVDIDKRNRWSCNRWSCNRWSCNRITTRIISNFFIKSLHEHKLKYK